MPRDFVLRQKLHFRYATREGSLETVLEKNCNTLTLVGLTPVYTRSFALQQVGRNVRILTPPPIDIPFDPRNVLTDIHRTLFIEIPAPPHPDGWIFGERGSERIQERWQDGRLRERRFLSPTDHNELEGANGSNEGIVILYEGGLDWQDPPSKILFKNNRIGYEIELQTLDYRTLTCTH